MLPTKPLVCFLAAFPNFYPTCTTQDNNIMSAARISRSVVKQVLAVEQAEVWRFNGCWSAAEKDSGSRSSSAKVYRIDDPEVLEHLSHCSGY
jgi:hypothetical protein